MWRTTALDRCSSWDYRVGPLLLLPDARRLVHGGFGVCTAESFRVVDDFRLITPKRLRNPTTIRDPDDNLPRSARRVSGTRQSSEQRTAIIRDRRPAALKAQTTKWWRRRRPGVAATTRARGLSASDR